MEKVNNFEVKTDNFLAGLSNAFCNVEFQQNLYKIAKQRQHEDWTTGICRPTADLMKAAVDIANDPRKRLKNYR